MTDGYVIHVSPEPPRFWRINVYRSNDEHLHTSEAVALPLAINDAYGVIRADLNKSGHRVV